VQDPEVNIYPPTSYKEISKPQHCGDDPAFCDNNGNSCSDYAVLGCSNSEQNDLPASVLVICPRSCGLCEIEIRVVPKVHHNEYEVTKTPNNTALFLTIGGALLVLSVIGLIAVRKLKSKKKNLNSFNFGIAYISSACTFVRKIGFSQAEEIEMVISNECTESVTLEEKVISRRLRQLSMGGSLNTPNSEAEYHSFSSELASSWSPKSSEGKSDKFTTFQSSDISTDSIAKKQLNSVGSFAGYEEEAPKQERAVSKISAIKSGSMKMRSALAARVGSGSPK